MSNLDNTRDNIRTNELSEKERKQIFQKFVNHGGTVDTPKPKRHSTFDRKKQREFLEKSELRKKNLPQKKSSSSQKKDRAKQFSQTGSSAQPSENAFSQNPLIKVINLLRIRFNLMIHGVTDFSGLQLKSSFIKKFNQEYKPAIIDLQLVYLEIFKQSGHVISEKIVEKLDRERPLLFELIEFGANIYDREITSDIIDEYIAFGEKDYKTFEIAHALTEYFKRIYLIINFQDTLYSAYDKAISYHTSLSKKGKSLSSKRRQVKQSINTICNKLFPNLYWLFCFFNSGIISLYDISIIDHMLELTPEMKPGARQPHSPSRLSAELAIKTKEQKDLEHNKEMEQAREEIKKKSAPTVPEEVKRGLKLMSQIKLKELAKKFIKSNYILSEYKNDPIIRSFLVFREFDEEYSILLTTNKIKVSVPSDRRHDTDYRLKLSELYNRIRHIDNQYKDYFTSVEIYHETEEDKPLSQNQYYHYSKRLTELENELKKQSKNLRNDLKGYFDSIIELFDILFKDMEGQQKIVSNPQENIELDYELEGDKKLKGKKIYQALVEVIDFSHAFNFRLSYGNDLSETSAEKTKSTDQQSKDSQTETETETETEKRKPVSEDNSSHAGNSITKEKVQESEENEGDKEDKKNKDQTGSIISELENFL
ncbi:MAG: hypothetical protein PF637_12225 [Spirochaetes bacterium]|jgi:hypothetical protein|nr:hypothetical protein [Spirochaetota bacterium]